MKTFFKLSLLILSLLSIFPSCKEEENESKPVLNNFYISSAIDATGDYRISTLDTGKSYYGMLNVSSEDAKVASVTVTQIRLSDSYTIPSFSINTPSFSGNNFMLVAQISPQIEGTWQFTLTAIDKTNEKECLQGIISDIVLKNGDSKTLNFSLAVTNKGTGSIYCTITYPSENIVAVSADLHKMTNEGIVGERITEENSGSQGTITIQTPGTAIYSNNSVEPGMYYLIFYFWQDESKETLKCTISNAVRVVGGATSTANISSGGI